MNLHSLVPDGNKTWVIRHKPGRIKGFSAFRFFRVSNYLHNNIEKWLCQDNKIISDAQQFAIFLYIVGFGYWVYRVES